MPVMSIAEGSSAAARSGPVQRDQRDRLDQHALATVAARLGAAFPDIPPADLEASIRREYGRFDGSRIRSFVPLLVEHAVRDELLHVAEA